MKRAKPQRQPGPKLLRRLNPGYEGIAASWTDFVGEVIIVASDKPTLRRVWIQFTSLLAGRLNLRAAR